jgi:hypothetical protein
LVSTGSLVGFQARPRSRRPEQEPKARRLRGTSPNDPNRANRTIEHTRPGPATDTEPFLAPKRIVSTDHGLVPKNLNDRTNDCRPVLDSVPVRDPQFSVTPGFDRTCTQNCTSDYLRFSIDRFSDCVAVYDCTLIRLRKGKIPKHWPV